MEQKLEKELPRAALLYDGFGAGTEFFGRSDLRAEAAFYKAAPAAYFKKAKKNTVALFLC